MKRTFLAIVSLLILAFAPTAIAQNHTEPPAQATAAPAETHTAGAQPAGEDHEAGASDHQKGELLPPIKQGLAAMLTAFVVFILVFLVLKSKAWPVIAGGLDERDAKIRAEISAAEKARQDAKDALVEYEESLNEARAEAKKILDETKVYQQQLAADLKAKADAELVILKDRARRDIDAAKKTAITEIYSEATNLSTLMAGKILKRQVNEADSSRLLEESLSQLHKVN
jgi:F-type H+-transporting ATPase subunit b